jgi:cold shock CspA family protein
MPSGTVVAFDDAKGFGTVHDDSTDDAYFFHCTAITDGTRTIATGTTVMFDVVPGRNGRWEATEVTPGSAGQPATRRPTRL